MSVLAAILVLTVLIIVHELGHFAAARLQRIKVAQFSIGFGPALLKYQGKETLYALRAIPLGGYVGFPDDENGENQNLSIDDPDLMRNRPIWDRALVISAGVLANLIFAYFLLVAQSAFVGVQDIAPGVAIPQIIQENGSSSAAAKAGLKQGDVVLSINEKILPASTDALAQFKKIIQSSPQKQVSLNVKRGQENFNIELTPDANADGQGKIGVMLSPNIVLQHPQGIFQALAIGAKTFGHLVFLTADGFWQLISNFGDNISQVAGPVKIVEYGANIAKDNLANLYQFAALISINLAIINILPLPALDGGQLVFLLLEALRGKPLPDGIQENIMQTGLFLMLSLGIFLIVRDTVSLEAFQDLVQ